MEKNYHDYHRGEIFFADLGPTFGCEQHGIRPVLILQNDVGNFYSPTVIVTTATRRVHKKPHLPTHVVLENIEGLTGSSLFQLETIRTLDKRRLLQRVGKLSAGQMAKIDAALRASLYLDDGDYISA